MRLAAITLLVVISSLSTATPQPPQRSSAVVDIALSPEGHLISRCEDHEGRPVAGAIVELVRDRDMLSWTTSRSDGSFTLRDVKPGTYRIQCGYCDRAIRTWSDAAAPPAARLPVVIVVSDDGAADLSEPDALTAAADEVTLDDAAGTSDTVVDAGAVLPLQHIEGSRRRADARVEPSTAEQPVTEAAADVSVLEDDLPTLEFGDQNTHAYHMVQGPADDQTFDPFVGMQLDAPRTDEPRFEDLADEPFTAPEQPRQAPPEAAPTPAPALQPVPQQVPPAAGARYIPRSVGPTVGDVVVTSIGITGITMGVIAIDKYNNPRIRRVVSP